MLLLLLIRGKLFAMMNNRFAKTQLLSPFDNKRNSYKDKKEISIDFHFVAMLIHSMHTQTDDVD